MDELIILVDKNDQETGVMEKLQIHQQGLLHRAFSIFIFNSDNELLLQQRAKEKYHSAGLWSNTCCSHTNSSENIQETIARRLKEEMGIVTRTQFKFKFLYRADLENGLIEHELDHVYFGATDDEPKPNKSEVMNWKYIGLEKLKKDISLNPGNYTVWLKICLPEVVKHFKQKLQSSE